jgi:hypothetical protein
MPTGNVRGPVVAPRPSRREGLPEKKRIDTAEVSSLADVERNVKTRGQSLSKISPDFRSLPSALLQPFSHIPTPTHRSLCAEYAQRQFNACQQDERLVAGDRAKGQHLRPGHKDLCPPGQQPPAVKDARGAAIHPAIHQEAAQGPLPSGTRGKRRPKLIDVPIVLMQAVAVAYRNIFDSFMPGL